MKQLIYILFIFPIFIGCTNNNPNEGIWKNNKGDEIQINNDYLFLKNKKEFVFKIDSINKDTVWFYDYSFFEQHIALFKHTDDNLILEFIDSTSHPSWILSKPNNRKYHFKKTVAIPDFKIPPCVEYYHLSKEIKDQRLLGGWDVFINHDDNEQEEKIGEWLFEEKGNVLDYGSVKSVKNLITTNFREESIPHHQNWQFRHGNEDDFFICFSSQCNISKYNISWENDNTFSLIETYPMYSVTRFKKTVDSFDIDLSDPYGIKDLKLKYQNK